MQSTDPILVIEHLTKKYDQKTAVDNISLNVARGDFFGFLGPNGAGKSSTIGCIIGVNRITDGKILVNGHDVVIDYKEARKQIGISAQEYNVDFFAPVEDLIDFMGGYYGVPNPRTLPGARPNAGALSQPRDGGNAAETGGCHCPRSPL